MENRAGFSFPTPSQPSVRQLKGVHFSSHFILTKSLSSSGNVTATEGTKQRMGTPEPGPGAMSCLSQQHEKFISKESAKPS